MAYYMRGNKKVDNTKCIYIGLYIVHTNLFYNLLTRMINARYYDK